MPGDIDRRKKRNRIDKDGFGGDYSRRDGRQSSWPNEQWKRLNWKDAREMSGADFLEILNKSRNIVLLGESGSGKSEIALNLAAALASAGRTVDLFDLDQTKPLFRSRDALQKLAGSDVPQKLEGSDTPQKLGGSGIRIHYADQLLDTPVVAPGVRQSLMSREVDTILDIGGFDIGARMIGRFADLLNNAAVFYIVNPYRPWSKDAESILVTMEGIRRATRLQRFTGIANPHLGPETTAEEFLEGLQMIKERLPEDIPLRGACCRKKLVQEIGQYMEQTREQGCEQRGETLPLLPLELFLSYEEAL